MAKVVSSIQKGGKAMISNPPVYDPNVAYVWSPEDDFILDGNEFGLLFQTLKIQSHSNTELTPKQKVDAYNVLEGVLKLAVEKKIAIPTIATEKLGQQESILPLDLPKL